MRTLIYALGGSLSVTIAVLLIMVWINTVPEDDLTIINKTGEMVKSNKVFVCDKPLPTAGWNGRNPLKIRFRCGYGTEFYVFVDFGVNKRVADHVGYVAGGITYSDVMEIYQGKIKIVENIVH